MGTKINSNYSDLLTFTRASKGHALRPVSYGDELVTNGDFSSSDGWTLKSNTTISGGQLTIDTTSDSSWYSNALRSDIDIVAGKIYYYEVDIESQTPSDQLWVYIGGGSVTDDAISLQGTGVITGVHIPTKSTSTLKVEDRHNTPSAHVINSISIKEVTFDQTDGTLTLFEHPENIPRVEYDAQGNRLGLLVEEQRINLLHYSEDFSQSYWNKTAATISTDVTTAPDGTTTADKLVVNNATADTEKFVNRNIYAYVNQTVTGSVFLKKAEYTWVQVNLYNLSSNPNRVWVNLDTGAVGTNLSSIPVTVTDVGNGWYRVALTATIQQVGNAFMTVAVADADGDLYTNIGDEESGTFLWGAQLEAGSFPTSYIKSNSGSTTTRSADVASIPVADFGYNQSAGTVVAEVVDYTSKPTGSNYVVSLDDNTASNRNQIIRYNNAWIYDVKVSNVTQVSQNLGTTNDPAKVAFAFKLNDFAATEDGDAVVTDTSGTVPNVTKMTIGSAYNNSAQLNGHIKSIKYYPRRLTNAQLQDLTS